MKLVARLLFLSLIAVILAVPIRSPLAAKDGSSLTVFSSGIAQVDSPHALNATAGLVRLEGISPRILVDSVRLTQSQSDLRVRSLTLSTEVLSEAALLKRYLGRTIGVVKTHPTTGAETVVDADVLSLQSGGIFRINGRIEVGAPGRLVFPDDTFGLSPGPTLVADLRQGNPAVPLHLSYLTGGFSWQPTYTATLNPAGDRLTLTARASVSNETGQDMAASHLRLVAGDIQTARPNGAVKRRTMPLAESRVLMSAAAMASDADIPERQTFGAFHLYTIPGDFLARAGETVQVALLDAMDIPVEETLISRGRAPVFGPVPTPDRPTHPDVHLTFTNTSPADGGQPLPAGVVRSYRSGTTGAPLFTGESQLPDTPAGAEAKLTLGRAFDVTVARAQTAYKRLDDRGRNVEVEFEVRLTNGRDKAAKVEVRDAIPGDWEILTTNRDVARDGGEAVWSVDIPAHNDNGGVAVVTYRVRVLR